MIGTTVLLILLQKHSLVLFSITSPLLAEDYKQHSLAAQLGEGHLNSLLLTCFSSGINMLNWGGI